METKPPKEKAIELLHLYNLMQTYIDDFSIEDAKQCAIICCDEVLAIKKEIWDDFHSEYFEYWQEVKSELEQL